MSTLTYTGKLLIETCWCGIVHAIPEELERQARENGKGAFCPLGHSWVFSKSDTQVEREKRERAERRNIAMQAEIDRARAEADHQAAVARGYKGALAKSKKRAAKGVCPVAGCKRHFADVERHIAAKHPDYVGEGA